MRKLFALSLCFSFLAMAAQSQLADTKWRSTMNIPDQVECILQFKKDTLIVLVAADQSVIVETMSYRWKNDSLTITKISGSSPCNEVAGVYKCQFKDEKLFITPLADDCVERANAFRPDAWIKEK